MSLYDKEQAKELSERRMRKVVEELKGQQNPMSETLKKNKKIADFMGIKTYQRSNQEICIRADESEDLICARDESYNPRGNWDQLMDCVERIEENENIEVDIHKDSCCIFDHSKNPDLVACGMNGDKKENVFSAVYEYISEL